MTLLGMTMDLHPTLDDILDDFIYCEMARVIHQGVELAAALKLHQAQMQEVCHSIKAHDHWVRYKEYFPVSNHCMFCEEAISPEFNMRRHRGLCILLTLHGRIPLSGLFLECPKLIRALSRSPYLPCSRGS